MSPPGGTPQGDFTVAVGTTLRGADVPPGGDTQFRIASITKTMTAAVIVLLAQEGKLQFSDPVSKYVPNVPNGENITIAQLLKMRSGLYGYMVKAGQLDWWVKEQLEWWGHVRGADGRQRWIRAGDLRPARNHGHDLP